jgi:DNA primase
MIAKTTIQKIIDEARVEEVVGEFVALKKRGSNLQGLCPFHNEKTPSFNVSPAKNIYKCFGCGKAGDPVRFLMDYQQLSYPDALRYLAKKYNIEIEETYQTDQQKQEEQEKFNLTESIHIANTFAQKFFSDYMVNNEAGRIGWAYFKERRFTQSTIDKFQLGFAPDGGDVLTKHAMQNGFQLDVLKKAGLTSPKENSTYDFFRNRVMFPIHNMTGKVVAFGGRIMVKDEKVPKYVNTGESEVYQKSKILYGAYFAKNEIRKKDECLLVEGYTDVISLHQAGIENVVASSGTALTQDQIRLIKRITPNITMLYDGDAAGIKAALRGTDLILEEGMNVRIVVLPQSDDPDSFVKRDGSEALLNYIQQNKKDLVSFKSLLLADEAKNDPIRKAQLIRDILESIAKIPDQIQRSVYIKESSQLFDMNEQMLITEVNKLRHKKAKDAQAAKEKEEQSQSNGEEYVPDERDLYVGNQQYEEVQERKPFSAADSTLALLEKDVIRIVVEFGALPIGEAEEDGIVLDYVKEELTGIDFTTPIYQRMYTGIIRDQAQRVPIDDKYFINHEDQEIAQEAIQLLAHPYSLSENWWNKFKIIVPDRQQSFLKDIQSAVLRLKQYLNIAELRKVEQHIKKAEEDKNEEEVLRLLKVHKTLMVQKKEFAVMIGNVVYRPNT